MKKFKAAIIDGRKIKKAILTTVLTIITCAAVSVVSALSHKAEESVSAESFYETIISMQLHNEKKHFSVSDLLAKIIGCDVTDAKSIIGSQAPALSEKFIPKPTAVPTPEQATPPEQAAPPEPTVSPTAAPVQELRSKSDMTISNRTNIAVDANTLADEELSFSIEKNTTPQILIFHTHTTESYSDSNINSYTDQNSDRSLDEARNIVAVGNAMEQVFANAGIGVIHDTTVHDYPSFNGAYTRSLATVKANLAKYPNIKLVLDIHRDGIVKEDGTKVKVAADIGGEKCAQCMFVIGSNANLTHNNWQENMKLACKIQKLANEIYPGLMRPIILREERFNQQISTGSVIIEIGSNGNTLSEAIKGGEHMASVITKLMLGT